MTPADGTVTVMTWNLWGRFGEWRARASAIDAVIAEHAPDILAVQEAWQSPRAEQIAELADRCGYHHAVHHTPAPDRGVGLLSRWPVREVEVLPLPAGEAPSEHRVALATEIDTPVGPRPVYVTHLNWRLDHSPIRRAQLAAIAAHIGEYTDPMVPTILCGDLNAEPDAEEIRMLTGHTAPAAPGVVFHDAWATAGHGAGHTWAARNPHAVGDRLGQARLDYILARWRPQARGPVLEATVVDGEHEGTWGSDHCAVLAVLDLH